MSDDSNRRAEPTPALFAWLGAAAVVLVLAAGFTLLARNLGEGTVSLAIGVAWWVGASAAALALARRSPGALKPVAVAIALATVAGGAYIYPSGGNEVDEQIATAEPGEAIADRGLAQGQDRGDSVTTPGSGIGGGARDDAGERSPQASQRNVEVASGTFEGVSGHGGMGTAAVVELAEGGRVITFSDFEVDPGAGGQDLRIWLSAGSPSSDGAATEDYVEIASLRGERGDQQYELPDGVDLDRYDSVVIWCVPFTTRIAQASLD